VKAALVVFNRCQSHKEKLSSRSSLMKANPWITYRTRFLVKAKQLTTSLTFTDALGRSHSGRKGDYLVESSDGILRIAPRQIFEDIYVPLLSSSDQDADQDSPLTTSSSEPSLSSYKKSRRPPGETNSPHTPLPLHLTRKSPQPYRFRRHQLPGMQSL
jgi:hypothetical protein